MNSKIFATILLFVALPFVFLGLIDPLEGGLALIMAAAIYSVAYLLDRSFPPRILWISFAVSIALGLATLTAAILGDKAEPLQDNLPIMLGMFGYRASVLVTLAAAVFVAVRRITRPRR